MNETVKAALLAERRSALHVVDQNNTEMKHLRDRLAHVERAQHFALMRADDISLHLRDNGVDLAAVDAEAEKCRSSSSAMQLGLVTNLGHGYGQSQNNMNALLSPSGVNRMNQFDPTAGLAKALDEA